MRLIITTITFYLAASALNNQLWACPTTWLCPAGAPLWYVAVFWIRWGIPVVISNWQIVLMTDRSMQGFGTGLLSGSLSTWVICWSFCCLHSSHLWTCSRWPTPPHLLHSEGCLLLGWSGANAGPWSEGSVGGWKLQVVDDGSWGRWYICCENCWQLDLSSLARPYLSRHRRFAFSTVTAGCYWCWLRFTARAQTCSDVIMTTF